MPRYYFDIRAGSRLLTDYYGQDLPEDGAAHSEASRIAAEIRRDLCPYGSQVTIEVLNRKRQPLLKVNVLDVL